MLILIYAQTDYITVSGYKRITSQIMIYKSLKLEEKYGSRI